MVGVVAVSHGAFAEGILSSAAMLSPSTEQLESLTLWPEDNPDEFREKLTAKIAAVDAGDGVFVLCDMLGGTPCNQAAQLAGDRVRVLTGLSLPMLISALSLREEISDHTQLAAEILEEASCGMADLNKLLKEGSS